MAVRYKTLLAGFVGAGAICSGAYFLRGSFVPNDEQSESDEALNRNGNFVGRESSDKYTPLGEITDGTNLENIHIVNGRGVDSPIPSEEIIKKLHMEEVKTKVLKAKTLKPSVVLTPLKKDEFWSVKGGGFNSIWK